LIERDWYQIKHYRLTVNGNCPHCGTAIAGRYDAVAGNFGRKRIPIAIGL
jgi:pyruvate formate lyase activating enzyme